MLRPWLAVLVLLAPAFARQIPLVCGTDSEKLKEQLFLHRQSVRRRAQLMKAAQPLARPAAAARDVGNIVVMEDSDGVVARQNQFDLDNRSIVFLPAGKGYRFQTAEAGYDATAASDGTQLSTMGDDDTRSVALPFVFPFYGARYDQVFVNSDGNLSFTQGDGTSADRSLGRLVNGIPRIAPLFDDLDPSRNTGGIRVLSEAGRFVVSWVGVPEYADFGTGNPQTFQVRLYPDGRIEFSYSGISAQSAVVGISPGDSRAPSAVLSFLQGSTAEYAGAIAERFTDKLALDIATATQKFYESHEDTYDYVMFFNNQNIAADAGLAYTLVLRQNARGIGLRPRDYGADYGSPARLRAVQDMGPLAQYPVDPSKTVPARGPIGDTPVTIIAHEAGHLFLAYASSRDPNDPQATPLLGFQGAHWSSNFNSDASLLEGNRIRDDGPGADPRFATTATVQGYSALDQYLMGLRPAGQVEQDYTGGLFFVRGAAGLPPQPRTGVRFNGLRVDLHMDDIVTPEGRRTPDHTVAQRHFRFAFVLVVREGTQPADAQLAQLEGYRTAFEQYFNRATGNRAFADTSLKRALRVSIFPASGVVEGRTAPATVSVDTAPAGPFTVALQTTNGAARVPAAVTIPAGAKSAQFTITAVARGVEEISAVPADSAYDTAWAKVQVAPASDLRLQAVSGLPGPVVVRLTDTNDLPYPGARIVASGSGASPAVATTDERGQAKFDWKPPAGAALRLTLEGAPDTGLTVSAGAPAAVVNAASFAPGIAPGGLASVYGTGLAAGAAAAASFPWPETLGNVRLTVNGYPARLLYVSDAQINFLAPAGVFGTDVDISITNATGSIGAVRVNVRDPQPGIFFDAATGFGAVLNAGTAATTSQQPARRGGYIEIYCTGLGTVQQGRTASTPAVTIGGAPARVSYSGYAGGFEGLYQVNVQIPDAAPSGTVPLVLEMNGVRSNEVKIALE